MNELDPSADTSHGVPLIPEDTARHLNPRQIEDYRTHRKQLIKWMATIGKNPDKAEGYAEETVYQRAYRSDRFYRFVWDEEDRYTTQITVDHADEFIKHLAMEDYSLSYKSAMQKAMKMLFKWQNFQFGKNIDWEPDIKFHDDSGSHNPRDFLMETERAKLREASLERGSVPHYSGVTPEERDKWKQYLAQRFSKPKDQIGLDDWKRANSFKIPSLINASLDAGFRPVEVERAKTTWLDLENGVLRIPKDESAKNKANWVVSLGDQTVGYLRKWLEERSQREKYEGTDALWLTQKRNPYGSGSLNRMLNKLLDTAGIERDNITWYSIRHSTATYMSREEGLAAAQSQLRHKSTETTMRYDQAPIEDRRDAINRIS